MKIGIIGAGQLGKMLALSGLNLGYTFRFLGPDRNQPCVQLGEYVEGPYDDVRTMEEFCQGLDVVTYEFENIPAGAATSMKSLARVFPPPRILGLSQDRIVEKEFLNSCGIDTAPFIAVDTESQLDDAAKTLGFPLVVKTRRLGYDGKGQQVVRDRGSLGEAFHALGGKDLILEGFIPFTRELALTGVRGESGVAFGPLTETHHVDGILRYALAPAPELDEDLQSDAELALTRIFDDTNYRGALTVEFFELEGRLIANEIAPRVHNSAHWSIEGAYTSQFENHIRAITGMPLGSMMPWGSAAVVNIIGSLEPLSRPAFKALLGFPGTHLHLYGKSAAPRRKIGHLTLARREEGEMRVLLEEALKLFPEDSYR